MNVITLCGSSKYKEEFIWVNKWLSLQGNVVISLGLFGHVDREPILPEEKILLDEVHKAKIDLADEIFVIDTSFLTMDFYYGNSTKNEIEYAKSKGKKRRFLTDESEDLAQWILSYRRRELSDWNK